MREWGNEELPPDLFPFSDRNTKWHHRVGLFSPLGIRASSVPSLSETLLFTFMLCFSPFKFYFFFFFLFLSFFIFFSFFSHVFFLSSFFMMFFFLARCLSFFFSHLLSFLCLFLFIFSFSFFLFFFWTQTELGSDRYHSCEDNRSPLIYRARGLHATQQLCLILTLSHHLQTI